MAFSTHSLFLACSQLPKTPKFVPRASHVTVSGTMLDQNQFQDLLYGKKLQEVKNILREEDQFEGLVMIDAIQRMGIDYHFQKEIDTLLKNEYLMTITGDYYDHHNLYQVSLRFRLLRQQGYHVPADVFSNFKDHKGMFKVELKEDIDGLMGLFEASQLSIGENILDDAKEFSSQFLNSCCGYLDPHQARIVGNTLGQPYHMSLASFTAESFINDFRAAHRWSCTLRDFAKLELNKVKSLHQAEACRVAKWWKELGLSKELEFARDQPIKWYMWPMAMLTDPMLTEQRIELTKPISLIYIIDDIFDVYGSLDELILFTKIVNRWDFSAVNQLPKSMRICLRALDDITNEISNKVYKQYNWNPRESLRKTWATLCNAYLVEAKWFVKRHMLEAEEYLKNGLISSGVHVVLVHTFFLLGQNLTEDTVNLLSENNAPSIISSTATIIRLWDDLGISGDEEQEGYDGSYLEYYMKEHEGSTIEGARANVVGKISDAWKQLNRECLSSTTFTPSFTKASLNLARMVPLMYSYDDTNELRRLEKHMKSFIPP